MNVKLLRKIEKHILTEPRRFWMRWFVRLKTEDTPKVPTRFDGERSFPKCGTAGCVAGWACILSKVKFTPNEHLAVKAAKLLDLDVDQCTRLFIPRNWPEQFKQGIADDGKKRTVKVAVARIEHFIATEGRE